MTYVGSDFSYNATNDNQDFTLPNTLSATQSYVDMLASTISDTLWELRWKITWDNYTNNTTGSIKRNFIGIFSTSSDMTTAQDGIFFNYGSESSTNVLRIGTTDGGAPNTNTGDDMTTSGSTTTSSGALLRQSATTSKVSLSSTSSYTEDVEIKTDVVASTTVNLQYMQHSNRSGSSNGTIDGTFDDVFFIDAVNKL